MVNLNEDLKNLNELIRTAFNLISPMTYHDDLEILTPDFMRQDSEKNPGCYLKLGQGLDHTLFPICNRYGYKDPQMMQFSLKLAQKMAKKHGEDYASGVIIKLQKLVNKYGKQIPKTNSQASLKGLATRKFNQNMTTPVTEWGNDDLNKDNRAKDFVKDLYQTMKDKELKESSFVASSPEIDKQNKTYGNMLVGGAAVVGTVMLINVLKSLYKLFAKEKDPEKRARIKQKIELQKQKIIKAKSNKK